MMKRRVNKIQVNKIRKIKNREFLKGLRRGSLNQRIFSVIAFLIKKTAKEVGSYLDLFCEFSYGAVAQKFYGTYYSNIEKLRPKEEEIKEWAIKRALKKLESLNYIKIKENEKEIYLTRKGLLEFIRYGIDQQKKKQKWDGKWRMVVFDISEHRRQIRDLLRNRLKWLGFKELQKSVWIFPYDARKEIEQIIDVCHIDIIGDVRFLTVEKMNDDEDLRKDFGLD